MGRLFVLFFLLPWWVYVPASIGALWVGERAYERALEAEAGKVVALETSAPAPVDLADFDISRDIHAAGEVHVTGRINTDLNHNLTQGVKGIPVRTRHMYMMFGASEPSAAPQVRAALMLSAAERAVFVERVEDYIAEFTDSGEFLVAFNGFAATSSSMDSMAADVIEQQGLTRAEDFIYIEPFFEGRQAALAPGRSPDQSRYIGWAVAALLALIGVVKRVRSVRARPGRSDADEVDLTGRNAYAAAAPSPAMSGGVSHDTPHGARNGGAAAPAQGEVLVYTAYSGLDPDADDDPDLEPEDTAWEPAEDSVDELPEPSFADAPPARPASAAASRFPPIPGDDVQMAPEPPRHTSAPAFYAKLALAMILVGALAYDPSLLGAALPVAGIALFWLGIYTVFRKSRRGAKRREGAENTAPAV